MNYRAWFVAMIGITAACKAGGGFNWGGSSGSSGYNPRPSSSSGDSSSSEAAPSSSGTKAKPTTVAEADAKAESKPTPVPAAVTHNKETEFNAIDKSLDKAEAWFLRYAPIEIKAACGFDVKVTIDSKSFEGAENGYDDPKTVVGEMMCGHAVGMFKNVCEDDAGKAAAKNIKVVHCEFVKGKFNTTTTTKVFTDGMGDQNALDVAGGKLTLKFKRSASQNLYEQVAVPRAFPSVEWMRETAKDTKEWNRQYIRWSEDKAGVEFSVEADTDAFAKAGWLSASTICGDGRYAAPLRDFLDLLYKTTAKGKKILQGVKKVTCAVTTEVSGKTPEIVGDRLIFYGRLLKEQIKGNTGPTIGVMGHGIIPNNDAYLNYAMFRKAKSLGGECPWRSRYMDKDPEGDKWCGPEKD